jgi:23S rRNA (cytidine1920-2'-O)/16S rRNA (cytidine1409-2'-O)-methyltransferase
MTPEDFGNLRFDIAVTDVSFISQTLIYEAASKLLKQNAPFVTLVKPQFEAGRAALDKNGIVRDARVYARVREKIETAAKEHGFKLMGYIDSSITGGDGNKEFLAYFIRI